MVNLKKEYHRLPGRGRKRGGFLLTVARIRARLWAGKDHLLLVYNSGYTEDYKRFYYRDIQAVVTRKTGRGVVWSTVLGLFAVFFAALSSTTGKDAAVVFWVIAGSFFALLLANILRGPTCITHLQTAVSREELPSLDRLRKANKVIERLRPLIEAAQGTISREEMRARATAATGLPRSESRGGPVAPAAKAFTPYGGRIHAALFSLLLVDGAASAANIFITSMALDLVGSALMMAISILIIISLAKQHDSGMGKGLRTVTWSSLAYVCLMFAMSYAFFVSLFVTNPEVAQKMNEQWAMLRMMSSLSPFDKPFLMFLYIFSIVCSVPLGIAGLALLGPFRREERVRARIHPLSASHQVERGRNEG